VWIWAASGKAMRLTVAATSIKYLMEVMNMSIEAGFSDNLCIIFAIVGAFMWSLMVIGDKLRGVKIENPEDHRNPKIIIVSSFPLLAFFGVSNFTPIVIGTLFWIGCVLIIIAGIIYVLSIAAFVKAQKGLTTIGIYQVSRNPMYITMFLIFIAFTLMAWQAEPLMGILSVFITLLSIFSIHWMVLGEERFLTKKYGEAYNEYMNRTARYMGIPKKES
jgi:protein-S-isoprenylcysteine O-methyltransferase Ste14